MRLAHGCPFSFWIVKGIADASMTTMLTQDIRKEPRQFGVHVVRSKLVDFAESKVFKPLTSKVDKAGMASHQLYQ